MMQEPSTDPVARIAADLLSRYGFDLGAFSADQLVGYWLRSYPAQWVRSAVVEALYQGRYKSVSVGQILAIWKRRGQPIYHYGFEFERMVCGSLARIPTSEIAPIAPSAYAEAPDGAIALPIASPDYPASDSTDTFGIEESDSQPDAPEVGESEELWAIADPSSTPRFQEIIFMVPAEAEAKEPASHPEPPPEAFEPSPVPDFTFLSSQDSWLRNDVAKHPIHQFVPEPETLGQDDKFYEKLRSVAQSSRN